MAKASKCAQVFRDFIYKTGLKIKVSPFFPRPILVAGFLGDFSGFIKNVLETPVLGNFSLEMCLFPLFHTHF